MESTQVALANTIDALSTSIEDTNNSQLKPSKIWLWHTGFGHVGPRRLQQLNLDFKPNTDNFWCTVCDFTKLTRNVSTEPSEREPIPLKLSQYSRDPCVRHRVALDRLFRYLLYYALIFDFNSPGDPVCFADAPYGDNKDDRKSTHGHTILLGSGAVLWSSKKQRCTVSSTTEAEYVAMCQAKDIGWVTRWMEELGFSKSMKMPIQLNGDNKGALDLILNPEFHARTKHVEVQFHFVREVIDDGFVITNHVPTSEMIADIFTKPLTPTTFRKFRSMLGVQEVKDEEEKTREKEDTTHQIEWGPANGHQN